MQRLGISEGYPWSAPVSTFQMLALARCSCGCYEIIARHVGPWDQGEGLSGDEPATVWGRFVEDSVCGPYSLFSGSLIIPPDQLITHTGLARKPG